MFTFIMEEWHIICILQCINCVKPRNFLLIKLYSVDTRISSQVGGILLVDSIFHLFIEQDLL